MKDKTILTNIKEEGNDINDDNTKIKPAPGKMKLKRNDTRAER
jgi:hypothetical protein